MSLNSDSATYHLVMLDKLGHFSKPQFSHCGIDKPAL